MNQKTVRNAAWIIGCKIVQSLVQLLVGVLSARYLGPSGYGLISYAAAVTAFAIPLMQLGLHLTLVNEYVRSPKETGDILGTSLSLNMVSSLICAIGVTAFVAVVNRGERETILVCILYSSSLIFQSFENLQCCFQAKLLSKYASLAMLGAHCIASVYKVALLIGGKSVYWFALSHTVEYGVSGFMMLAACRRLGLGKLRFCRKTAKNLLNTSRHYIPAALLTVVINSTAGILLKLLAGPQENGYFAAALTSSIVLQFVYAAVLDSARPGILAAAAQNRKIFEQRISGFYGLFTYMSLAQSAAFMIFSKWIIKLLYGASYGAAVPVLQILIWQTPFALMGWVRDLWLLAEGKHRLPQRIHALGAVTNVILNLLLIPRMGACGAAVTAVVTQGISHFLTGFLLPELHHTSRLLWAGVNPGFVYKTLKELRREL